MAAAAFWKGYLKLSLVTCAVSMMPATTESEKVRFHTINRATGRRVRSRYVDAETGKPVDRQDEVKGYETEEGRFVTFEDEEFEAVALESVRTIDIETFAPAESVSWIWHDKPYYMKPADKVGEEAFSVIREAMAEKGVVGISRLVLHRREYAVMLQPRDNGIILWTLRHGEEVRDPEAYFSEIDTERADPKLLDMITRIIERRSSGWDPRMVKDPVQTKLLSIIAAKRKSARTAAHRAKREPAGEATSNVVSLMDALKKSLEKPGRGVAKK